MIWATSQAGSSLWISSADAESRQANGLRTTLHPDQFVVLTGHHDFINVRDFPQCWYNLDVTVEVEAKAKEVAIQRLRTTLEKKGRKVK